MQEKQRPMTIGLLAQAAGVGVETVRFYQRKGLLETPDRTTGFRTYTPEDVRKIKFIKRVQDLGFSLKDVQNLIEISFCSNENRPLLAQACNEKIGEIQKKISDLTSMLEMLQTFYQSCAHDSAADNGCSLLDCFENNWECCNHTILERKEK
ncbi:MAG: MerR family transcriptional regulator [Planctomycetota bacterium]|nr:MerR family transcriptional regulator [Planctomycetota bacterium]